MYPLCKVTKVACVRGSTGCWWYKEPGRVKRYVLDLNPDLLIIGGISHRDDTESVREVVRQVRAGSRCDILLVTGVFGRVDPDDDTQWSFAVDPTGKDYRARLRRVADDERTGFFDMTAYWGKYVRESGKGLKWFKRDDDPRERARDAGDRAAPGGVSRPTRRAPLTGPRRTRPWCRVGQACRPVVSVDRRIYSRKSPSSAYNILVESHSTTATAINCRKPRHNFPPTIPNFL